MSLGALTPASAAASLEHLPDSFALFDERGTCLYVNRAAERALGRGRHELLGRAAADLYERAGAAGLLAALARVAAGGAPESCRSGGGGAGGPAEHYVYRADGGVCVLGRGAAAGGSDGGPGPDAALARLALDRVPALVAYVDAGQRYRLCSGGYERWFGTRPSALVGRTVREVVGDAAYAAIEPHVRAALGGTFVVFSSDVPYRDGGRRWIEAAYAPDVDEGGRVRGFVSLVHDVSERRRADTERELLLARATAGEARLRRLYDADNLGVAFWTRDGIVSDANGAFVRLAGYERGEMRAGLVRWRELTPPEFVPLDERALAELDARGACAPYEKELLHKGGHRVPVLVGAAVRGGADGEGVVWALDLTERKRADQRQGLLVSALRALAASDDVSDALATVARLAVRSFGTLATVDLVGDGDRLDGAGAVAHRDPGLQALAENLRRRFPPADGGALARVARTGEARLADGPAELPGDDDVRRLYDAFAIQSSLTVALASRGRAVGVLSVSSSERRYDDADLADLAELGRAVGAAIDNLRLFATARAERARAESASRAKDEFLAVVSHELRTPLTSVLGWAKMVRAGALDEQGRKHAIETIERNARSQVQLVEDLLDLSRIVTGKLRLNVRPVNLPQVVEAAVDTVRPSIDAKGVRLQVVLDPGAGPIVGDPHRLEQAAWNLLSNAARHTPAGGRIYVRLHKSDSYVELTVEDTGEGITPDVLPHVFEPFRQADAGPARRHGGLGLGLSIVKHIAELHGGAARAHSEGAGKGATFVLRLPIAPLRSSRVAPAPPGRPAVDDVALTCPERLAGLEVLVVDDDDDSRELIRSVLAHCKAAVDVARSAGEALERLSGKGYDVILSDVGMPGVDGYALVRQLRALPADRGGRTPAVALTAFARMEDRMRALLAGFTMHVAKPVDPNELVVVVASVAGRST